MHAYSSLADEFYSNMNLSTEMPLPNNRETVLGFLERVQKSYPTMRNFYTRDNGDFVLEEDKDQGQQRWLWYGRKAFHHLHARPAFIVSPGLTSSRRIAAFTNIRFGMAIITFRRSDQSASPLRNRAN